MDLMSPSAPAADIPTPLPMINTGTILLMAGAKDKLILLRSHLGRLLFSEPSLEGAKQLKTPTRDHRTWRLEVTKLGPGLQSKILSEDRPTRQELKQ